MSIGRLTPGGALEPRQPDYDRLLTMLTSANSLLVSYRSIFLTADAIFFAIAAVFFSSTLTTQQYWLLLFLSVIGVGLSLIWVRVCRLRGYDERFFEWRLRRLEKGWPDTPILIIQNLYEWRNNKELTSKLEQLRREEEAQHEKRNWESESERRKWLAGYRFGARRWMDTFLPWLFAFLWIVPLGVAGYNLGLRITAALSSQQLPQQQQPQQNPPPTSSPSVNP